MNVPTAAQAIGVIDVDTPLWSLDLSPSPRTVVKFACSRAPSLSGDDDDEGVLVWIDATGTEKHSYALGRAPWTHVENTQAGHAFAVFQVQAGKPRRLVASYRVMAALAQPQRHLVTIGPHGVHASIEAGACSEARVIAHVRTLPDFPAQGDWAVTYSFVVPSLPVRDASFFETHTIYVWGDLSFDNGPSAAHGQRRLVHDFKMNQIVPQVMCGRCLSSSGRHYLPRWRTFTSWVMQAQHYWQTARGEARGSRALCGKLVRVESGEVLETTIALVGGEMRASIRVVGNDASRQSEVRSSRVFPSHPRVFPGGWREFFAALAGEQHSAFAARPCFNIEYKANEVDLAVFDELGPLRIKAVQLPGMREAARGDALAALLQTSGMNLNGKPARVCFD